MPDPFVGNQALIPERVLSGVVPGPAYPERTLGSGGPDASRSDSKRRIWEIS